MCSSMSSQLHRLMRSYKKRKPEHWDTLRQGRDVLPYLMWALNYIVGTIHYMYTSSYVSVHWYMLCVCMRLHAYTHKHAHTHTHTQTHTRTYTHKHTHTHTHTQTHTRTYTHKHTHSYTCVLYQEFILWTLDYTQQVHIMHTWLHTYINIL